MTRQALYRKALGMALGSLNMTVHRNHLQGTTRVYLEGLEVGVVRDSQVNVVNDFEVFREAFEDKLILRWPTGTFLHVDP